MILIIVMCSDSHISPKMEPRRFAFQCQTLLSSCWFFFIGVECGYICMYDIICHVRCHMSHSWIKMWNTHWTNRITSNLDFHVTSGRFKNLIVAYTTENPISEFKFNSVWRSKWKKRTTECKLFRLLNQREENNLKMKRRVKDKKNEKRIRQII